MVIYWSKVRRPVYGTATVKELTRLFQIIDTFYMFNIKMKYAIANKTSWKKMKGHFWMNNEELSVGCLPAHSRGWRLLQIRRLKDQTHFRTHLNDLTTHQTQLFNSKTHQTPASTEPRALQTSSPRYSNVNVPSCYRPKRCSCSQSRPRRWAHRTRSTGGRLRCTGPVVWMKWPKHRLTTRDSLDQNSRTAAP